MSEISGIIIEILFFAIPIGCLIWFLISLIRFLKTPKDDPNRKKRMKMLVISAVPTALICISFVVLLILIGLAVAHM